MKKKIIVLLTLIILGSQIIADKTATAQGNVLFEGGSGTESDPYQIADVEQLQNMNQDLDACYVLVDDIDASETKNWNDGKGFEPIAMDGDTDYGFQGTRFTGDFNGQGHSITGLYINRPSLDYVGFIGHHQSGTISNLGLVDCDITGDSRVGALVGHNHDSISSCYVEGVVIGNRYVGGFVGRFQLPAGAEIKITDSYAIVEVNGNSQAGGFVGYNPGGIIENCYSAGPVTGGGFVGDNTYGTISNSFWDKDASGTASSPGGTGKTTAEMKDVATYTDTSRSVGLSTPWDFVDDPHDDTGAEDHWDMDPEINDGYPYLSWQTDAVTATIDIHPDTLNLKSKGKWITFYIELPPGFDVSDIHVESLKLMERVQTEPHPTNIGDQDKDDIADLMVKFDRQETQEILVPGRNVEITISGELSDGTLLEGSHNITVK
jgi:hypothetical protein